MASAQITTSTAYSYSSQAKVYLDAFLKNGSASLSTSQPTYRASSYVQSNNTTTGTSLSHTLSSNIVAGDVIILAVVGYNQQAISWSLPAGWVCICNSGSYIFAKTAVSGDIGATITIGYTSTTTVSAISFAVAGCSDLSSIHSIYYNSTSSSTTLQTPSMYNAFANSLAVTVYAASNGGATTTFSGTLPGTTIGQQDAYNSSSVQSWLGASYSTTIASSTGTVSAQTCTMNTAPTYGQGWVILFAPGPAAGTVPPGGWTLIDEYMDYRGAAGAMMWHVWKSPAASNNIDVDYYITIGSSPTTSTDTSHFQFMVSELYTGGTTRTIYGFAPNNYSSNTSAIPNGTTTPPWAHTAAVTGTALSSMNIGSTPPSMSPYHTGGQSLVAGTNNHMFVANADGLLVGNTAFWTYVGSFTSLVQNPNLPNPDVCIGMVGNSSTFQTSGANNPAYLTRDYVTVATHTVSMPFTFGECGYRIYTGNDPYYYGFANTPSECYPDLYAFPANDYPVLMRVALSKAATNALTRFDEAGGFRCLAPNWILCGIGGTGTAFGDTFTVGTDTYVNVSPATTYTWVDSNA